MKNRKVLIEQKYGGEKDYTEHFYSLLPAFLDNRYIKQNGKPLFTIYFPQNIPGCKAFVDLWQNLAQKNGLPGIFFIGLSLRTDEHTLASMQQIGMNAITTIRLEDFYGNLKHRLSYGQKIKNKLTGNVLPSRAFEYKDTMKYFYNSMDAYQNIYPTIISGWDHSPRTGSEGLIMYNYTPELFKEHVTQILSLIKGRGVEDSFVFLKSWNEWAEGNYMEPDLKYGHQFLQALKEALDSCNK